MPNANLTYCRVCEASCGLEVERDANGKAVSLRPDRNHPVSKGFACAKGTRFLEVSNHPNRLLYPMLRDDRGHLNRVGWGQALKETAVRIRSVTEQHGPHAVGVYFGNPLAFNTLGGVALARLMRGLGSRNVYSAGSQDCNNKFAAASIVHGSPVIHPVPDLEHTDLALMFGTNPAISQSSFIHLEGGSTRVFDGIEKRGGKIVWIDPRLTESAKRWGEHLAIYPGTDSFLLLGLLHLLRDMRKDDSRVEGLDELLGHAAAFPPERVSSVTGIPVDGIIGLAARIRASRSTAFHMSVGVNQTGFGTFAYVAMQALAYLTGNYDRQGGVLVHPLSAQLANVARTMHMGTDITYSRIGHYPSVLDTMPGGILADEILTPGAEQVRVLLVIAGDPLRTMPDTDRLRQAFQKLEWLVVIDMFETDTGREADLLLPATSWTERFDVAVPSLTFQHGNLLQFGEKIEDAPGETRTEADILAALAREIGGRAHASLRPLGWAARMESSGLLQMGTGLMAKLGNVFGSRSKYGLAVPATQAGTYLGKGPRTPGNRMRFWNVNFAAELTRLAESEKEIGARREAGTYLLMGRRRRLGHNGWLQGGVHDGDPEAVAWLHADDASSLGLPAEGGFVRLSSATGELEVRAKVAAGLAPRTVVLPHGIPGVNFNRLVPTGAETIDRLSGQHKMTGIPISVSVVQPAQAEMVNG